MAKLFPSPPSAHRSDSGYFRELDVLERLEKALPDGYEIFHSVEWHSIYNDKDTHGEIDVVVMNRAGDLLLMEVKAGQVEFLADGIYKQYGSRTIQVDRQGRTQHSAMVGKLNHAGIKTSLKHCLVLPDCRVLEGDIVAIPRERIIDSEDFDNLASKVLQLLPQGLERIEADEVRRFLRNILNIAPDVSVLHTQLKQTTQKLADGLATWVPRIESPSGIIRILATAGSGKTQLALRLLEDAAANRSRSLYVCYNRPLADHISCLAPVQAQVGTFHELCIEHFRRTHGDPDFSEPGIFERAVKTYLNDMEKSASQLDLLIIDEAQDFEPEWVTALGNQLKSDGKLYLLEDDDQRLYERELFNVNDAVVLRCDDNFRSPKMICEIINAFGLPSRPIRSRSPFRGQVPEFIVCDANAGFHVSTARAVDKLIESGFKVEDIAVLTARGHGRSTLLGQDRLGRHTTRRFRGGYSKNGDPVWTGGDLLIESVYRFKGQSAPAVVLTEFDFDQIDAMERRRLFVGMTRAQMALSMVLSEKAERTMALAMS